MTEIWCAEIGCGMPAYPTGPPFPVGSSPGDVTLMRKFRCFRGHSWWLDLYDYPEAAWLNEPSI